MSFPSAVTTWHYNPLRALWLLPFFMAAAVPNVYCQPKDGWKVEKIGDFDYLPLSQIQKFYHLDVMKSEGKNFLLENKRISIIFENDSTECTINGIKFVLLQEVKTSGKQPHVSRQDLSYILDPVLRPNFIKNAAKFKTVILDPANGGKNPGITNEFGTEAGFTLKVALKAKVLLEERGYQVVMTREDDKDLLLQERVAAANGIEQDAVFVSISFESGPEQESGIQTLPLTQGEKDAGEFRHASMALATSVHSSLISKLGKTKDRGIEQVRHSVLSSVKHPAVLVEGGYMTHPSDSRAIASDAYQTALAQAITAGIQKYGYAVGSSPQKVEDQTPDESKTPE